MWGCGETIPTHWCGAYDWFQQGFSTFPLLTLWARSFVGCVTASLTFVADAINTHPVTTRNVSIHCLNSLGGQNHPSENHGVISFWRAFVRSAMRCMPFDLALAQLRNLLCRNTVQSGSTPDSLVLVGKLTGLPWSFTIYLLIAASMLWGRSTVILFWQMETVRLRIRDWLQVP